MGKHFHRTHLSSLLGTAVVVVLACLRVAPVCAESRAPNPADFLYQLAQEYRQTGQLDDAIHELRKLLLIDPHNEQAQRELAELEEQRDQAMQETINQLMPTQAIGHQAGTSPWSRATPVAMTPTSSTGGFVRFPDLRVNGTEWLYVFGRDGKADYGAEAQPQAITVSVPTALGGVVIIRVLDADIRGRHDEIAGEPNTSTAFRVFGGSRLLASQTVGPDAPDGTTIEFGPFSLEQGEQQDQQAVFRIEAEGLEGDDNNRFAIEVSPATVEAFSFHPAIRLARHAGDEMRFFPEIPAGTTRLLESNFDLDPDGGRIELVPFSGNGRLMPSIPVRLSGSGTWASTEVVVPPEGAGTRWTYRITKDTQVRGNMSFRFEDQDGRPLQIYFAPGIAMPAAVTPKSTLSCNAFEFDASQSYDPDKQPLTFSWDFGDGTTGEGIRTQHAYERAGDYRVVLSVKDPSSTTCCQAQTQQVLHVNTPPKAVLDAPPQTCVGASVPLSAARSSDSPGEQLSYAWDFGDGTRGQGSEVTHAYARGGAYQVRLVVNDNRGTSCSTDVASAMIRVNTPPIARANDAIAMCSRDAQAPLEARFNGSRSSDPDRDTLSSRWDFGDGASAEGLMVSHTYRRGGRYTATLTVDDGTGTACSASTATVPVQANHAPLVTPGAPVAICPQEPMTLDATHNASDPDGDSLSYRWDFGDGQTATGATVQHRYETSGTYRVRLTADDGSNMTCSASSAEWPAAINAPPVPKMVIRGESAQ
ncbi:MAG: PKD domain-containing protein [Candidatus Omnitrophica bacterium]|nr:PKD domain-containing protein [Candidatus Omnitrophota bacterium]